MRVRNDKKVCLIDDNDKPGKYDRYVSEWERTLWETYAYRNPSPDCDTKRAGPCKIQDPKA